MLMALLESPYFRRLAWAWSSNGKDLLIPFYRLFPGKWFCTGINTGVKKSGHRNDSLGNGVLQKTDHGFGFRFFKDLILVPLYGTLAEKK
jgi:hypothetical protein